ncbi:MAG: hypothetical protein SX243_23120 [Acidobacteriota bacterium]|nr:hypothetical protein [Acidobacteriota bacterium]
MQVRTTPHIIASLAVTLLAVLSVWPVQAADQRPFSIPISPQVLEATLVFPDGSEGTVQVRDGSMITISDNATGETHHIVPALSKDEAGKVEVLMLRGFQTKSGASGVEQIGEPLSLSIGDNGDFPSPSGLFSIKFDSITSQLIEDDLVGLRHDSLQDLLSDEDPPVAQESECCVSCGAYTVCACVVNLNCGTCCSGDCCEGIRNEPKTDDPGLP